MLKAMFDLTGIQPSPKLKSKERVMYIKVLMQFRFLRNDSNVYKSN